ncbi:hypothetical protein N0V93_003876 [Gnomoniopsis smithogilvyi]|uniref:F-box domain-containing protein n=1 Tax=Gnomoniopsis smithogilvyi TaxID=1191159 RepID=A0A9W8Z1A0_9PEZI|nr:hypothetical protein N0V93_003876 [Gnomoniopsis smithogilvyi]
MASNKYRVNKEIILHVAEQCDLQTLSAMMRTCKDLYDLITNFEHSISKAKIAASHRPHQGLLLSSEDEQRCTILERNTFATVREIARRKCRIDSLLNRCGFLLTGDTTMLGMTSNCLDKFKVGLCDAIYLADQLADLATQYPIHKYTKQVPSAMDSAIGLSTTDSHTTTFDSLAHRRRAQTDLRRAQVAHLRSRTSRELAWLLTLAAGGSKGFARYSARLLESDPAMADARMMAFKEVLLRHGGSMVLWGFMRGSKTLGTFVQQAVGECAQEVMFFEHHAHSFPETDEKEEDEEMPGGLHMCVMAELNQRIVEEKRAKAAAKGESFAGEVYSREVWEAVHTLVGKEIGCETWRGYAAVRYPA